MFENKYKKAITFSFDDGTIYDKKLVELLNKYNLKATFNLNSGIQTRANNWVEKDMKVICRMNQNEILDLYKGHEIASHTLTHPYLTRLDYNSQLNEIKMDIDYLKFNYNCPIIGFAYPFGMYNDDTIKALKECNIKYARTAGQTMKFDIPEDLLKYTGTIHFLNPKIMDLAKAFLQLDTKDDQLFYIWGHSYELELVENGYEWFENFLKLISNKADIYYCTNKEAFKL